MHTRACSNAFYLHPILTMTPLITSCTGRDTSSISSLYSYTIVCSPTKDCDIVCVSPVSGSEEMFLKVSCGLNESVPATSLFIYLFIYLFITFFFPPWLSGSLAGENKRGRGMATSTLLLGLGCSINPLIPMDNEREI